MGAKLPVIDPGVGQREKKHDGETGTLTTRGYEGQRMMLEGLGE